QAVARLCRGELDYRCAVSRNGKSNRRSTLQGHTGCGNGSSRALRVCPRHQQRRSLPCTCHEYDSGGGGRILQRRRRQHKRILSCVEEGQSWPVFKKEGPCTTP